MWKKGQPALVPLARLFLVLALSLFVLPRTAEASVPLQVVSTGHGDGLPKHAPQYQWLFTGDVLVLAVADVRRPALDEPREPRRSLQGFAACVIVPFQVRYAGSPPALDYCPELCAGGPPGFVPRL